MSRRILFRPEAEVELMEAASWYEERGKGLGADFLRSLDAAVAAIERNPHAYPIVFGKVRRSVLRRFPYIIIYRVENDEILILACIHGRRDPKRWQERQ
jgi:plasmid stabilization system protein ParE